MEHNDIRNLIALYLNDKDLINFISINKLWRKYYDKKFWIDIFEIRKYPIFKLINTFDEWLISFKDYCETLDFTTEMLNKCDTYSDVIIELKSINSLNTLNIIPQNILKLLENESDNAMSFWKSDDDIAINFHDSNMNKHQCIISLVQFMTLMYYICAHDIYSCHMFC